ncbi:proteasome inhibitor PI31 subunit-like [Periplaneta americana]|uniref:proteasome inhibitor PI31 subunit-like n=1 Tax=Periplaneta americana TaxID=6978 RepID=UPI0037E862B7
MNMPENIQKELLDPVITDIKEEATMQMAKPSIGSSKSTLPLFQDDFDRPGSAQFDSNWDPNSDPMAVGRSDLDAFTSGGGMIFSPFGHQGEIKDPGAGVPDGLPRGSIPPGARFDPFGPPNIDVKEIPEE